MIIPPPTYPPQFAVPLECIASLAGDFLRNSSVIKDIPFSSCREVRTSLDSYTYFFDFKDISSISSMKPRAAEDVDTENDSDDDWFFIAKPKKTITFNAKIVTYKRGTPVVHFLEPLEEGEL